MKYSKERAKKLTDYLAKISISELMALTIDSAEAEELQRHKQVIDRILIDTFDEISMTTRGLFAMFLSLELVIRLETVLSKKAQDFQPIKFSDN
jgi:hypothetical protein